MKYTPLSGFTKLSNTSKADANFYRIIVSTVSNPSGQADEDRSEVQSICIVLTMILQILYPLWWYPALIEKTVSLLDHLAYPSVKLMNDCSLNIIWIVVAPPPPTCMTRMLNHSARQVKNFWCSTKELELLGSTTGGHMSLTDNKSAALQHTSSLPGVLQWRIQLTTRTPSTQQQHNR